MTWIRSYLVKLVKEGVADGIRATVAKPPPTRTVVRSPDPLNVHEQELATLQATLLVNARAVCEAYENKDAILVRIRKLRQTVDRMAELKASL